MDFQVVALGDFPIERSMTRRGGFHMHFMANIVCASGVVRDQQTYHIDTDRIIYMRWVRAIPFGAIPKKPMVGYDIVVAGGGAVEMDFQVIALGKFPIERGMAFGANGFHNDFVTYIIHAAGIVGDGQADQVGARLLVGMVWIGSVTGMSVTEVPGIGHDIMIAGGGAVEMNLQGIVELFPVEFRMAFTTCAADGYFMAYIAYTACIVRDDQAYDIYTGRIIDMGWVSTIAL